MTEVEEGPLGLGVRKLMILCLGGEGERDGKGTGVLHLRRVKAGI